MEDQDRIRKRSDGAESLGLLVCRVARDAGEIAQRPSMELVGSADV